MHACMQLFLLFVWYCTGGGCLSLEQSLFQFQYSIQGGFLAYSAWLLIHDPGETEVTNELLEVCGVCLCARENNVSPHTVSLQC